MVELKVRKIGNSLGVVLPKEIVEHLHTGEGKKLFLVESADQSCQITAYDPEFSRQMKLVQAGMDRYRNTLRELAK
jgi:putative addiction module antidote